MDGNDHVQGGNGLRIVQATQEERAAEMGLQDHRTTDDGTGRGESGKQIVQATEEARAAIRGLVSRLAESAPPAAGVGRAPALAWAGLRLAFMVLLAAGVGIGLGDGDEFDDVGCSVAQQPGGSSHGAYSGKTREQAGDKLSGSEGGAAGGGGAAGRPEGEAQEASGAQSSHPAGGQEVAAGAGSGAVLRPRDQGAEGRINGQNGSTGDSATEHREVMEALKEIRDALEAVRRSAGQEEPIKRSEAQRIFAVLQRLRSKRAGMMAPLYDVFVATVLEGRSQRAAAKSCDCSSALLSKRVGELEKEFGLPLKQLQNYAKPLLEMETSVKGQRYARKKRGAPPDEPAQYDDGDKPDAEEDDT
jgi:hypothetical protein